MSENVRSGGQPPGFSTLMGTDPQHYWIVRLIGWFRRPIVLVVVGFAFRVATGSLVGSVQLKMQRFLGAQKNVFHPIQPSPCTEGGLLQSAFGTGIVRTTFCHGTLKGFVQCTAIGVIGRRRIDHSRTRRNALDDDGFARMEQYFAAGFYGACRYTEFVICQGLGFGGCAVVVVTTSIVVAAPQSRRASAGRFTNKMHFVRWMG